MNGHELSKDGRSASHHAADAQTHRALQDGAARDVGSQGFAAAVPTDAPDRADDLSFPSLCAAMDASLAESEESKAGKVERWSFAIGLLGAGVGLLAGNLLGGTRGIWLAGGGLVVERAEAWLSSWRDLGSR
jgi:hypothetical protein